MTLLLLILACETAQPLPPSAKTPPAPAAQMVKSGDVSGLLVDGDGSSHAVLLLVDDFDEAARTRAQMFSPAPVLAITPATEIKAAQTYLSGLPGIKGITILCHREDCPEVNLEEVRSTSASRRYLGKRDRPSEQ